jgi:hypothetical protein
MIQSRSININTLYNPQLIDLYFSYSKAVSNNIENAMFVRDYKWKYKDREYSSRDPDVYEINSFYVTIDHNLRLEKGIYKKFEAALRKNRIARESGQDGVKFLDSRTLEAKIHGEDFRLLSHEFLKGTDDQRLYIFNTICRHAKVKRQVYKHNDFKQLNADDAQSATASTEASSTSTESAERKKMDLTQIEAQYNALRSEFTMHYHVDEGFHIVPIGLSEGAIE